MKIIIALAFLCTCSLFSMDRQWTQQELEQIWYVQQMKALRKLVDHKETLSNEQYNFYIQQQKRETEEIRKDGVIQR